MISITERPKTLDEVYGQKLMMKEFKKRSLNKNFPSYLLFTGPTGVGKSTTALIIAKILNCENPIEKDDRLDPCNKCSPCKDINNSWYKRDVSYLDATNLGKNQVKDLSDILSYPPMLDKNKIIIIDEAHLLASDKAKGAMLLLSEKERKNCYIILCTTDQDKILPALNDRYATYRFRYGNRDEIAFYLKYMIGKLVEDKYKDKEFPEEFLNNYADILFLIAENCRGSFRLAVQYLDRVLEGELYSIEVVKKELNLISEEEKFDIISNILSGDNIKNVFNFINDLDDIDYFYNILYKDILNAKILQNTKNQEAIDNLLKKEVKNGRYVSFETRCLRWTKYDHFEKLYKILYELELNKKSFTINKRLFLSTLINYFEDIRIIPKIQKRKSTRERVN